MHGYKVFKRDKQGRKGGEETLNAMEIEINDDKVKCLCVRIMQKANKVDILVGVSYRPPSQEEELEDISGSPAIVLVEVFQHTRDYPYVLKDDVMRKITCLNGDGASEGAKEKKEDVSPLEDGIYPRMMRKLADEFAKSLSIIYQQSWLSREVPDDWKLDSVTPIYKKGQKENSGNYRPVSMTSLPSKIMEHIILSAITRQLQDGWVS
ncbi:hypothetical protein RLOC_00013616 [Lonchura striata]|uniref:RNA-directed DNA polymerase from mobile element jockey n=1 Tax=Lonchura striata TaxID=40157 RepID=A0A218VE05_9PASE|nr:hypothetical protein RLOC_00013616 [Lonchura striata domestica]